MSEATMLKYIIKIIIYLPSRARNKIIFIHKTYLLNIHDILKVNLQ